MSVVLCFFFNGRITSGLFAFSRGSVTDFSRSLNRQNIHLCCGKPNYNDPFLSISAILVHVKLWSSVFGCS